MWVMWFGLIFVALGFVLGRHVTGNRITSPVAEEGIRVYDELVDILTANGWRYNAATRKVTHPVLAGSQPVSITLAFRTLAYAGNQHASTL